MGMVTNKMGIVIIIRT